MANLLRLVPAYSVTLTAALTSTATVLPIAAGDAALLHSWLGTDHDTYLLINSPAGAELVMAFTLTPGEVSIVRAQGGTLAIAHPLGSCVATATGAQCAIERLIDEQGQPAIDAVNSISAALASVASPGGGALIGVHDAAGLLASPNVEAALAELALYKAALGLTTAGNGASRIGVHDAAGLLAATNVEAALAELAAFKVAIGSLAAAQGASLVGVQDAGGLFVATTVEGALAELATKLTGGCYSLEDFGAKPQTGFDNSAAFAAAVAFCAAIAPASLQTPKLSVCEGTYEYATSPNWAVNRLVLSGTPGTIFRHTGAGNAFILDGGAAGGGVYNMRVEGGISVRGNSTTTNGIYLRAVHHSKFDMGVRDVSVACLATHWAVANEFHFRSSPIGEPLPAVVPVSGMFLSNRAAGEQTSACTFISCLVNGVSGYGYNLDSAVQNTFIGGASESNGGGIFVSANSIWNTFISTDMEFNSVRDVNCFGSYNLFQRLLSDTNSSFGGTRNMVLGGVYNIVASVGAGNEFNGLTYNNAGTGSFTDTGSATVKRTVRNGVGGALDPEVLSNPHRALYLDGAAGNTFVMGRADGLTGGPAADTVFYKYGAGETSFFANGVEKFSISGTGLGFFGTAPAVQPNVSGSRASGAALTSLLSALTVLGLISNSTTA